MKNLKLLLITSLFITTSASAGLINPTKTIATLKDRSGKEYNFNEKENASENAISDFQLSYGLNKDWKEIFAGKIIGDGKDCEAAKQLNIEADKLITKKQYTIKDLNGDGLTDIRFFIKEEICNAEKNHKYYYHDILSLSKADDFKVLKNESDGSNPNPEPKWNTKLIVQDKNGEYYELRERYGITHGSATYEYDFGKEDGASNERILLFKGKTYTDSEKCPTSQYAKKYVIAESAITKHVYESKDLNGDGINDLNLKISETHCVTGIVKNYEKKMLSDSAGFKLEQNITEGK